MTEVIIIGGGLLGLSTAYSLLERGYAVRVIEAGEGVGEVTSFANAGMITASMSDPWNAPGVGKHLLSSLFDPLSPMKIRPHAVPSMIGWGAQFLRNSSPKRHRAATIENFKLAHYSALKTTALRESLNLHYGDRANGTLKLFRNKNDLASPLAISRLLEPYGLKHQLLDADGAVEAIPQLSDIKSTIAAAIYYPDDESGDAHQLCTGLARKIISMGGDIQLNTVVEAIIVKGQKVVGLRTANGEQSASQVVVAAGNDSTHLLRPLGIKLPIQPAKGYSITFDTQGLEGLPQIPLIDETLHAAITPIGNKIRLAGTVEFTGYDTEVRPERLTNLTTLFETVYPHLAARAKDCTTTSWACLRPMSADGRPFIGPTQIEGLSLNTGHGHLGLTKAVGSGQLCADMIAGIAPEINVSPFLAARLY